MTNMDKKISDIKACRNILIPRFDTFGDIVLLQGFIKALLDFLPEARITILVREGYDQLARMFPERLHWKTTRISPYQELTQMAELTSLLKDLKNDSYDLLLMTTYSRTWLDDLLAATLISSWRLILGKARDVNNYVTEILSTLDIKYPSTLYDECIPVEERIHETEKYQILWESITGSTDLIPGPQLMLPDDVFEKAKDILTKIGLTEGGFVFCFPAGVSNVSFKTWPEANFSEVITLLEKRYSLRVLVAGHETEKEIVDKVVKLAKEQGASPEVWLGNDGDLSLACALIAKSFFYFGNDTGLMHMAAALNKPIVAIFGGGSWPRFLPRTNSGCAFVLPLPCFYCMWNCFFNEPLCIKFLSVDNVIAEMGNFIKNMEQGDGIFKIIETNLNADHWLMFFKKSVESIFSEKNKLKISEADREARLAIIHDMAHRLETDRKAHLADREAHMALIDDIARRLEASEADREARVAIIHDMARRLEASEANRQAQAACIQDILTSSSWRLTAPLRRLSALVQRVHDPS